MTWVGGMCTSEKDERSIVVWVRSVLRCSQMTVSAVRCFMYIVGE